MARTKIIDVNTREINRYKCTQESICEFISSHEDGALYTVRELHTYIAKRLNEIEGRDETYFKNQKRKQSIARIERGYTEFL